jgi:hypothetical protein
MMVSMKIVVFWDVMPCRLVDGYQTTWHHIPKECNLNVVTQCYMFLIRMRV